MKKKILVSAAGTASAWHIINTLKRYFSNSFEVWACDINPYYLIPSSKLVNQYVTVPRILDPGYYDFMLELLIKNKISIYIPLIDFDLELFTCDNPDLKNNNIISTGPSKKTADVCIDKYRMSKVLLKNGVKSPKIFNDCLDEIVMDQKYIIKPQKGFGSKGIIVLNGSEVIKSQLSENVIIQELCSQPEITVEVFNYKNTLKTVSRERLEVKAGVCTKAKIYYDEELHNLAEKIKTFIDLPVSSCIQFMKNSEGQWCVTDINLRLGAGTALSTAVGFQLTKAFLNILNGSTEDLPNCFADLTKAKFVTRYYEEMVML